MAAKLLLRVVFRVSSINCFLLAHAAYVVCSCRLHCDRAVMEFEFESCHHPTIVPRPNLSDVRSGMVEFEFGFALKNSELF